MDCSNINPDLGIEKLLLVWSVDVDLQMIDIHLLSFER